MKASNLARSPWAVSLPPALLALALCLYKIRARELWHDEFATWWAATLPLDGMWRLLSNVDAVMAPYIFLVRGTIALGGDSHRLLRLPSALAMAVAAGLTGLLGRRLFNARVGLSAGCLFALIPNVSRYGQEARGYALALAASVLAVLLLLRAVEAPLQPRRWAAYGAGLVLVGSFHLVALINLLPHAVVLFERRAGERRPRLRAPTVRAFCLTVSLALIVLSPLIYGGAVQREQIAWARHASNDLRTIPERLLAPATLGYLLCGVGLLSLLRPNRARLLLASWAFVPPLLLSLTHTRLNMFVWRYMLFVLPALALACAASVDELAQWVAARWGRWLGYALPLGALLWVAVEGREEQRKMRLSSRLGYSAAIKHLAANAQSGDAIAYMGTTDDFRTRIALAYYWKRRRGPPLRDVFMSRPAAALGTYEPEECADSAACLPADVTRLWVLTSAPSDAPFAGMPDGRAELLQREFETGWLEVFRKLLLLRLDRRATQGPSSLLHAPP